MPCDIKLTVLVCVLLLAGSSRADTLTLVTGKTLTGKISFDTKNAVTLTPKDQPAVSAPLKDLITLGTDAPVAKPGVAATLIDGTRVAGASVLSMDERELRLKRPDGGIFSVSPSLVSVIDFAPAEVHAAPSPQFVGAVLAGKDVSEGDVLSISQSAVKIGSVLFGVQEFDTAKTVRAVYLRPPGVSKSAYVVRGRDGSVWQATSLALGDGKAVLGTDLAGPVTLAATDLAAIDLGPAAADDLFTFTASPGPMRLAPGQEQTIDVAGKYRAVVLRFGVPNTFMPLRAARLMLIADDKEIAKTEALTSIDRPVTITRPIDGVKRLTFKLEATGPQQLGIAGEIDPGRLVRTPP